MDAPGKEALLVALRGRLTELELSELELAREVGCPLAEAPVEVLAEWLERLDWYCRRLALVYVSDSDGPGY